MGPRMRARCGRKYNAMTATKPTPRPTQASIGNENPVLGSSMSIVSVAIQPNTALVSSSTNNTAVALMVPLTVIVSRCHGVTGPSVIGGAPVAVPACGAGQLRDASLILDSLNI